MKREFQSDRRAMAMSIPRERTEVISAMTRKCVLQDGGVMSYYRAFSVVVVKISRLPEMEGGMRWLVRLFARSGDTEALG